MKFFILYVVFVFAVSCGDISTNITSSSIGDKSEWNSDTDDDKIENDYSAGNKDTENGNNDDLEEEEVDYSAHYIPQEECTGIYLDLDENGDCFYNCPENSVPDHETLTCVCAKGTCKVGLDYDFRIICEHPSEEGSEPYFVNGTWSCSVGTTPSNCLSQCVCQEGYVVTGEDEFGRRICEPASAPGCPLPYKVFDYEKGECRWNCAAGTEPDDLSGTCLCKDGYEPAPNNNWLDSLGRLICFKISDEDCNCPKGKDCVENICMDYFGPDPQIYESKPPLMRGLYNDGGEGSRFFMTKDMDINAVRAGIWADGSGDVTMKIFRVNSEDSEILAETKLSFSQLPFYYGIHSEFRPLFFILQQPVEIFEGDIIDVVFASSRSLSEHQTGIAVSGIYKSNIFDNSEILFYNGSPGLPNVTGPTDPSWDYLATLVGTVY
jgi:hypothetical protein